MIRPIEKRTRLITSEGPGMFNKAKGKGTKKRKVGENLQTELNRQTAAEYGISELHELVRSGSISAVEIYLKNNPEHLNNLDTNHTTAACLAAQVNNLDMLSILAKKDGIDFTTGDFDDNTPMSWAKKHANEAMINLIKKTQTLECLSVSEDCEPPFIRSVL